jgi:hypothetical protein
MTAENEKEQERPQLVTIEKEGKRVVITFEEEELQGVHFLIPDIDYLLQQYHQENSLLVLTEKQFKKYLYDQDPAFRRKIPMKIKKDFEKDIRKIEYSWNVVLKRFLPLREEFATFLEIAADLTKEKEAKERLNRIRKRAAELFFDVSWHLAAEMTKEQLQGLGLK